MEPDSQFMAHWQPLLNLIALVEPPHLKKALRTWVNKNQNCAYSVKTGACAFNCSTCPNDITIEHILVIEKAKRVRKTTKGVSNEKGLS